MGLTNLKLMVPFLLVAPLFDERNPAVLSMIADVIASARVSGKKIGRGLETSAPAERELEPVVRDGSPMRHGGGRS